MKAIKAGQIVRARLLSLEPNGVSGTGTYRVEKRKLGRRTVSHYELIHFEAESR